MLTFVIIATVMVAVALGFILPPLLRRDTDQTSVRASLNRRLYEDKLRELEQDLQLGTLAPEQFEQARQDLISSLAQDNPDNKDNPAGEDRPAPAPVVAPPRRWLIPTVGLAVIAAAVGLYLVFGAHTVIVNNPPDVAAQPPVLPPHPGLTAADMSQGAQGKAGSMDEAVERLAKRLEANPDDAEGWLLLGRSYQFLKRYPEADSALKRAISLGKTDPATRALQAQVHALAAGSPAPAGMQTGTADEGGATPPGGKALPANIDDLIAHLKKQPDDGAAWTALARAYQGQQRYLDAADAYAKATTLVTDDARLFAEYADALAAANGKHFNDRSLVMVKKALSIDPDQPMALWLAATAALQTGDKDTALRHWLHLQKLLPPDSEDARIVAANIAELKGEPPQAQMAEAQGAGAENKAAAGATVRGVVSITPELAREMNAGDTLFIYAKANNGPPMPLAVLRKKAGDLPVKFELDDSMAMTPMARLSNYKEVIVGARISHSGSPLPSSGDLEGTSGVVRVGDDQLIHIVINHRV